MMDINQKSIINAKCPNIGYEVRIPFQFESESVPDVQYRSIPDK